MEPLTMRDLEQFIHDAKEEGWEYIGLMITMPGFPRPELIINTRENFDKKLEYYQKTYDVGLNHNYADGIKIVNFYCAMSLAELEEGLFR